MARALFGRVLSFLKPSREPYQRTYSDVATEEDIYYCFRLLLNRNPDKKEWYGHRQTIGTPLVEIVRKFLRSDEFNTYKLAGPPLIEASDHIIVNSLDGFRICIHQDDNVCGSLRENGEYEAEVTSVIKKILREGMTFVDIGANIGYFSVLASRLVRNTGRVVAVEPYPYNIKLLNLNLALNTADNVEILPFALSDRKGFMRYDDSAGNSGNIFALCAPEEIVRWLDSEIVYTVRLEDALERENPIDLIKMDIEGAEYLAIKGMKNLIREDQPIIITELFENCLQSVSKVSLQQYLDELLEYDYRVAIIRGVDDLVFCGRDTTRIVKTFTEGRSNLMNVVAYPEHKEMFLKTK